MSHQILCKAISDPDPTTVTTATTTSKIPTELLHVICTTKEKIAHMQTANSHTPAQHAEEATRRHNANLHLHLIRANSKDCIVTQTFLVFDFFQTKQ